MTVLELIPSLKVKDKDYIDYVQTQYSSFKTLSELPPIFMNYTLNESTLPNRLSVLYNKIYDIVSNRYSYLFYFSNHNNTGYLGNCLLDNYFKICIENNYNVEQILFIDTKLFLGDFTKQIAGKANNVKPALTYSLDTLYREIELAPMVIWDNFEQAETNFEMNKLYEVLYSRYRRMLGNLFFTQSNMVNEVETCLNHYDTKIKKVMDPGAVLKCQQEEAQFKLFNSKGVDIKW